MASARFFAEPSVKSPEISPAPSKLVKVAWSGWMIGADCTTPSSSMASSAWKFSSATLSHAGLPFEVKV